MTKSLSLFILLTVVVGSAVQAQELPPLVTGAAWKVKAPNGMEVQMTFNPDGSGKVNAGFLSNKVGWSVQDGAFCITGLPDGGACMALTVNGDTVVGTSPDGKQFVFEAA